MRIPDPTLCDPARLHLLAESGVVSASAVARLPTLDRVARLAAHATRSSLAQVNLVSANAQIPAAAFVDPMRNGAFGDPLDVRATEPGGEWRTPVDLDRSYCHNVVRSGEALIVDNAQTHPVVASNKATTEAGIGSYAGVPLVMPNGQILGTVCVVNFEQRDWSTADVAALEECAALASEEIAARVNASHALSTSYAELERALAGERAARASAENASEAKSQFLSTMSHELRTPLNAIAGYAELLENGVRGPVTDQQRSDLRRIISNQQRLLSMVNDVLRFSQLADRGVVYTVASVRIADVVAKAVREVSPIALAGGIAIDASAVGTDAVALVDADRLREILVNLLSNAVKFSGRGTRVQLATSRDDDRVRVRVADQGIGIDPSKHEEIFAPFVQASGGKARSAEGAGLGLAIARRLARDMGGDVEVESELGNGAAFTLTLPAARAGSE